MVVLEHAVRASLPNRTTLDMTEGQAALLHDQRIEPLPRGQAFRADWVEGRLSVLDEPLAAVVDALRPYRAGLIRVSPAVRDLRVQGVFPWTTANAPLPHWRKPCQSASSATAPG